MVASASLYPVDAPSRTDLLMSRLVALARSVGPGGQLPTVRELAGQLQASTSTLDRVLESLELKGLIERSHGRGIFVAPTLRARSTALVIGFDPFEIAASPFYHLFLERMGSAIAARAGEACVYGDVTDRRAGFRSQSELEDDLRIARVQDMVYLGVRHPERLLALQAAFARPTAAFTNCPFAPRRAYLDYPALVRAGVETLAAAGSRRLALIPYPPRTTDIHGECVAAFRAGLAAAGLADDPARIWRADGHQAVGQREGNDRQGWRAANDLFAGVDAGSRPDGVVSVDDGMTTGLLAGLHLLGLSPLREVRIATHANRDLPTLTLYASALWRLEFDCDGIAQRLLALLDGDQTRPCYDLIPHARVLAPAGV